MQLRARTVAPIALVISLAAAAGLFWMPQGTDTPAIAQAKPASSSAHSPTSRIKPKIRQKLIPFGSKRKREMAAYSLRHYGKREWRLRRHLQIVQHYSQTGTVDQIFNTFAPDYPDAELGELPNTCAHFAIAPGGRVYQLVNLRTRCRHVVGLNYMSIGIEHVGYSDQAVLGRKRQMRSSLKLTRWLRCVYDIKVKDVIGHNESLSSRYHRERIKSLKQQTHGDFRHSSMNKYRKRLRAAGKCPAPR
ncbi:MAG: peptidoglycan recognition family protein [Solirubrobacterales bacterium]